MPVKDSFTLAELGDFEKNFKPIAPVAAATAAEPSGEQQSGAQAESESQPTAQSEQLSDSSTDNAGVSDGNVEVSSAESTTVDASDDSDPADLTSETADPPQPSKTRSRAQERIEDLVASNKALKASLDYLQAEVLTKLQPQAQSQVQPAGQATAAVVEESAPTLESCGFDTDKWTQAMQAWTDKRIQAGVTKAVQTVKQEQTLAARMQAYQSREAAFAAATPDYGIVVRNPALPNLAAEAASLVIDSDLGPQIIYHFGKNPEKAARIARQTPAQQSAAIGRLEVELAAKPSTQKKPATNITRAPNPPTPTAGRGNTPSVDPNKMSTKEWVEWDRRQTEAKRRARKSG